MGSLLQSLMNGLPLLAARHRFIDPSSHHAQVCASIAGLRSPVNYLLELAIIVGVLSGIVAVVLHIVTGILRAHHHETLSRVGRTVVTIIVLIVVLDFAVSIVYLIAARNTTC